MKMYTIDGALLCEQPEIRIDDKVYPVDDRKSTVEKIMKKSDEEQTGDGNMKMMEETLQLALGKDAAAEIAKMDLHFAAYLRVFETVMAIITGETPEEVSARFQERKKNA